MVVGFRPGTPQADGTRVVRGRDALAWPEVFFRRLGWVPFSPTPNDDTFTQGRPELAQTPVSDPAPAEASRAPEETGGPAGHEVETQNPAPAPGGPSWRLGGLVAAVIALPLLALATARRVRTLRHRRRGAAGAWAEVYDALVLAGSPPPRWEAAPAVAERADRRFGTDAAARVAERAERAAFGPATATLPAPVAEVRAVRRAARASVPWWRRWWWAFDPRVLGR